MFMLLLVPFLWMLVLYMWVNKSEIDRNAKEFLVVVGVIFGLFLSPLMGVLLCSATTGMMSDYSIGDRLGYITKVSHKGLIWKTWEVEVQIGTGEQSAIQSPHQFCAPKEIADDLIQNLGKKAKISYRQWFIVPFSVGNADSEIIKVEWR